VTVTRTGAPTITGSRLGWAALAVYLATRAVSTLFILAAGRLQVPYERWTGPGPVTFLDMSVVWDGSWYRTIAEDGYPAELPLSDDGVVRQNQWAFYPLFPMLSRGLMVLTGMDFRLAGTLVALVTGCGAAVLMVRLFARYAPPAVALAAMGVWAVQPAAPTLQIAYTESLAVLVLVGFFLALVQRNWLLVGVLAVVLGVTRPIALPLALVVGVVVLLEVRRWWTARPRPTMRTLAAPVAALLVTGFSGLIWPTIVTIGTGRSDGYAETMASWRAGHEIVPFRPWIDNTAYLLFRETGHPRLYAALAVTALALLLILAAAGPWARRLPLELRLWIVAYPAYLAAVLDVGTSLIRYAIPLFPIALILIGGGARRIPRWWPVLATVLAVLLIVAQHQWTTQLLVLDPPSDFPP